MSLGITNVRPLLRYSVYCWLKRDILLISYRWQCLSWVTYVTEMHKMMI